MANGDLSISLNIPTVAEIVAAVGAGSDPLTKLVPEDYAAGTAGAAIGRLTSSQPTVISPVLASGKIKLVRGDDYTGNRALVFTKRSGENWPTGWVISLLFVRQRATTPLVSVAGTVGVGSVTVPLSGTDTAKLTGTDLIWRLVAVNGSQQSTLREGPVETVVQVAP